MKMMSSCILVLKPAVLPLASFASADTLFGWCAETIDPIVVPWMEQEADSAKFLSYVRDYKLYVSAPSDY